MIDSSSAANKAPLVHIVILNWNGWKDTIECLESLQRLTYPNYQIIVIENGSTDGSLVKIKAWARGEIPVESKFFKYNPERKPLEYIEYDKLTAEKGGDKKEEEIRDLPPNRKLVIIQAGENLGFCAGNNLGMKKAVADGADYVVILNNDTIVNPGFIQPLVEVAQSNSDIGLLGGVICFADNPETIWFAGGAFDDYLETRRLLAGHPVSELDASSTLESDWISGCMMMIPRRVYKQVGDYDERFFIWSEEWDYCIRVKKMGYRLAVVAASRIYHKVGQSLGVMKPLSYYYGTRNRLLLKRKHLSWLKRVLFMGWFFPSRVPRYIQFALQGRWDLIRAGCAAIRDYFLGRTGKWRAHKR